MKSFLRLRQLLCLFVMISSISSCTKDVNSCETCKVNPPNEINKVKLLKKELEFNIYKTQSPALSSFNFSYSSNLRDLLTSNNIEVEGFDLSKINNNNLAAIVIFSNIERKEINFSDIDRMIFYVRQNDGFRTFLFKNENNVLNVRSEYSFHTNYFASNDIYDFQSISAPNVSSNGYIVINKSLIAPINSEESDLQLFLEKKTKHRRTKS